MSEKFLLSLENPNFESYMETVQVKMKEIFSQAYEEDLYSFVRNLLTIPEQTKENVKNELIEVFGQENQNVLKFLEWLWSFLEVNGKTETKKSDQIIKEKQVIDKEIQEKIVVPIKKPQTLLNKKPIMNTVNKPKPPLKNLNNKNFNNNFNVKNNNDHNNGMHNYNDQTKDKKSILDRIKKPKNTSVSSNNSNPIKEMKKTLARPALRNIDIKEKLLKKKLKTETVPIQNIVNQTGVEKNSENILGEEEVPQDVKEATIIKKRCRDWPCCKNEQCVFHHPTEQCKKFPKCSFGNQCLYIHPSIECKFGVYCRREDCAYVHPKMSSFQPPPMHHPHPFFKEKQTPAFLAKKNVTLNTTNDLKMKFNEEESEPKLELTENK